MLASVGCKLGYDNVLLSAFILSAATLRCLTSCLMALLISLVHVPTRSVAMLRASSTWTRLVFLCIFIMFLLGGFNLEGNVVVLDDPDMHEQSEWTEQFLLQVEEEKRAIEELPFVKSVGFTYGETANANKDGVGDSLVLLGGFTPIQADCDGMPSGGEAASAGRSTEGAE